MAVTALQNFPKAAPPPAPVIKPKADDAPKAAKAPVASTPAKPHVAPPKGPTIQVQVRREAIHDRVELTARHDQGKFGHVQPAHTGAAKPVPKAAPGQAPSAPKRHAINIIG